MHEVNTMITAYTLVALVVGLVLSYWCGRLIEQKRIPYACMVGWLALSNVWVVFAAWPRV